jgi:nucleoside-diphosphate-sugar epimerase
MTEPSASTAPTPHGKGEGEHLFITGATGFLGRELVHALLAEFPEVRLSLLVRDEGGRDKERLIRNWTGRRPPDSPAHNERLQIVAGDVGENRCGLRASDYSRVVETSTRIIHAAARVQFDDRRAEAEHVNVGGTRHMLELAEDARRHGVLQSFTYMGTAFVAGERSGTVSEEELEVEQRFRNNYPETKCAAEKLVRERSGQMPVVILRPSIIVGDSGTGITSSFRTLYWPLKVYARHGWRLVPGFPDVVVDIVPVDFVARAAARLALDRRAEGRCCHLCAGAERSATLGDLAAFAGRFFQLPPPRFVHPALFLSLLRPILLATLWGPRRRVLRDGPIYRRYLRMRAIFDTSHADALLLPHGIRPPRVQDYFEKILRYCVESDWGRKRAPVPEWPHSQPESIENTVHR